MLKTLFSSRVFGNTAIYMLANVLNGAIPFFLLPVLTRVFTPEEYGLVTLVSTVVAIVGAFTGLSVHGAVSVKYFDKTINHPQFVGTCLLILIASTSCTLLFLVLIGDTISSLINVPKKWLLLATIISAAQFIVNIRLILWQVANQPIKYGLFQISQTLLNLALSLSLVFWALWGWEGRSWGIAFATLAFAIFALISFRNNSLAEYKYNPDYLKKAIAFGLPLIPHTLGGLAMSLSDRFILSSLIDVKALGIYAVGIQMALVVGLLGDAIAKSYGPYLLKLLSEISVNQKYKIVKTTYLLFLMLLILATIYMLALPFIYKLFIGPQFVKSLQIAQIACFGYAFQGMYYTIVGILFYKEKTTILSTITLVCGTFGVLLSIFMVKTNGLIGCAWAFLITWLMFFLVSWVSANKAYPLPWLSNLFMRKT